MSTRDPSFLIPCFGYEDAKAAIRFPEDAFGFVKILEYREAGAKVVWEPHDTEFGTRRYRVLDLEGHEWNFGNYRPGSQDNA